MSDYLSSYPWKSSMNSPVPPTCNTSPPVAKWKAETGESPGTWRPASPEYTEYTSGSEASNKKRYPVSNMVKDKDWHTFLYNVHTQIVSMHLYKNNTFFKENYIYYPWKSLPVPHPSSLVYPWQPLVHFLLHVFDLVPYIFTYIFRVLQETLPVYFNSFARVTCAATNHCMTGPIF